MWKRHDAGWRRLTGAAQGTRQRGKRMLRHGVLQSMAAKGRVLWQPPGAMAALRVRG